MFIFVHLVLIDVDLSAPRRIGTHPRSTGKTKRSRTTSGNETNAYSNAKSLKSGSYFRENNKKILAILQSNSVGSTTLVSLAACEAIHSLWVDIRWLVRKSVYWIFSFICERAVCFVCVLCVCGVGNRMDCWWTWCRSQGERLTYLVCLLLTVTKSDADNEKVVLAILAKKLDDDCIGVMLRKL